jgi:hypothetical protein
MKISLKIVDTVHPSEEGELVEEVEVSGMSYSVERDLNRKGEVVSNGLRGSGLKILTREFPQGGMLRWLFSRTRRLDGEVVAGEKGKERPLLHFSQARPVAYSLRYDAHQGGKSCLTAEMEITADKIVTDQDVTWERRTR